MKVHTITVSFDKRGGFYKKVWRIDGSFALSKSKILILEEEDYV